eukprot:Hpha_TRINITY_DN5693_c0_g1::TRINITY_DN5693_c0_g1_i1::g.50719::m.50719
MVLNSLVLHKSFICYPLLWNMPLASVNRAWSNRFPYSAPLLPFFSAMASSGNCTTIVTATPPTVPPRGGWLCVANRDARYEERVACRLTTPFSALGGVMRVNSLESTGDEERQQWAFGVMTINHVDRRRHVLVRLVYDRLGQGL